MNKLLIAAAVAMLVPATAFAQDVSGAWKLTVDIGGMMIPVGCTFAQMDTALSGTCDGADGKPAAVTGKVDGTKLTWAYDTTFNDMPMHVAYAGEIKADGALGGTIEAAGGAGTFTGTK